MNAKIIFFLSLFATFAAVSADAQVHYKSPAPLDIYPEVRNSAPGFALKTNLLYGFGTLTPNIAAEIAVASRWTAEVAYSSNPWNSSGWGRKKLTHGIARVEARHWLCERFNGHFFGIHGLYSEYNINGVTLPPALKRDYRYHGRAWGGGIGYGYNLPVGKRWNIEFTAGVGIYRFEYDRFSCGECDRDATAKAITYFGPGHIGVTAVFLFK